MRFRLLAAAVVTLAGAIAGAGVVDDFRAVVETRRDEPGLSRGKRRALTQARDLLVSGGLLADDVRAAHRSVAKVEGAFRTDVAFDAAESILAQSLLGSVRADRALVARLHESSAKAPSDATLLARADRAIEAADAASSPPAVLRRLDAACSNLRRAFPPIPAITAPDANIGSPTFQQPVTVRGQVNRISAWYFVHTT